MIVFLFMLIFSGCAAQEEEVRRYFWPPLPDTPMIEFVASYRSADDFPPSVKQRFLEAVTGTESAAGFEKPWGIASNGEGQVYVVDTNLKGVLVFDLRKYSVDLLGRGVVKTGFFAPAGIALDGKGSIYISDPRANKVYAFSKDEKPMFLVGDDKSLNWPVGIAVNDRVGRIYVVNTKGHNISVFDMGGKHLFSIGKRGAGDGEFNFPTDVDLDSKGNLVIADSMNARIQILDPDGRPILKFGQRGDRAEDFQVIKGVAVSRNDDIYVTDGRADRVLVFNSKGDHLASIGWTSSVADSMRLDPGGFFIPQDIDIDKNDTVYVVDSMNKRFQVFQIINDEWLKEHPIK